MKFTYTEYGHYVADVTYEIKIEDINKILVENYPGTESVDEQIVMDIILGHRDFDDTKIIREDGVEELLNEVIYDIVSELKYGNELDWKLCEADSNYSELEDIEKE